MGQVAAAFERVSLRTKLTALAMALIGLLLIVSSLGTISLLRTYLQQNVDTLLTSTASTLSQENPLFLEARLDSGQLRLPRLPSDYYIAFLDDTGNVVAGLVSSANESEQVPDLSALDLQMVLATGGLPFEVRGVDGAGSSLSNRGLNWRMVALPLSGLNGSVVVALPTRSNDALIDQYRGIGAGFGLLLLLVSGLSIWLTITSALRPLREVERTANQVAKGDTSQRLLERPGNTEIARLNRSLNSMLEGIDDALHSRNRTVEQMRRFIADASHELRTPLVSLRGYAELYRMGALKKKSQVDEAMQRIESEAIRMSQLVESLLTLTRLDETKALNLTETEVSSIVQNAIRDAEVASGNKRISLIDLQGNAWPESQELVVSIDGAQFRQVVINLLSNATRFAGPNGPIEVAIGSEAGQFVVEVRDHGEGIPKELRDKVFERFYRADNSRNRETGGSGLGSPS